MTILAEAPRGGLVEELNGAACTFLLRNREIEMFEDKHRGIFDVWEGFFGSGKKPTSKEVKDLIALGLVGGGMKPDRADKTVKALGPDSLMQMYSICQAMVGIAFMPDAMEGTKKKPTDQPQGDLTSET